LDVRRITKPSPAKDPPPATSKPTSRPVNGSEPVPVVAVVVVVAGESDADTRLLQFG
jgi:hypothetical protein